MSLFEKLVALAAKAADQGSHLGTEEATKNALVMPFINALGYNVFDPLEVVPEFTADVGIKKGERVDYAVMVEGRPVILVEAKSVGCDLDRAVMSQLFRYFAVTDARIAISTNGVQYRFFSDLEQTNRMDERPFLELDLKDLRPEVVDRIQYLTKELFDESRLLEAASELKYKREVKRLLANQLITPDEDFVRLVASQVFSGRLTRPVREQFAAITKDAFGELIRERVQRRLKDALSRATGDDPTSIEIEAELDDSPEEAESEIVTTAEELQGYYIVKGILRQVVDASRIAYRDVRSYFGILLDDNNRKPLARLRFNSRQKYLGLFDNPSKTEERVPIGSLDDLYQYAGRLRNTPGFYDSDGTEEEAPSDNAPDTELEGTRSSPPAESGELGHNPDEPPGS